MPQLVLIIYAGASGGRRDVCVVSGKGGGSGFCGDGWVEVVVVGVYTA